MYVPVNKTWPLYNVEAPTPPPPPEAEWATRATWTLGEEKISYPRRESNRDCSVIQPD
jgi:hypothetical protein